MNETSRKIAAGLERAFAARGFAEPSVEALRDAAGVSLRTLYKYAPSREDMVRAALEHRHERFLKRVFGGPLSAPETAPEAVLDGLLGRIADWMREEASHGCLFHAAVAAAPQDARLRGVLARHKAEVAERTAAAAGLAGRETDLTLIIEGLTQAWPLHGEAALDSARRLSRTLAAGAPPRRAV